ncbi:hypothetical protein FMUND_8165 [Fusarium mundagurra]|uniref:Uncharacterized protein n=1 Tax=Fusarium mundagurra TaxID=1567541 RepID=A0A8H6DFA1_9HYPO|nr:hypothetical protein FMUND_8165 [Fusarium mundagurra]
MSNSEIDLDLTEIHFDFFCKVGGTPQMLHALIAAQEDDVRRWSSCPSFGSFIQKLFVQSQDVSRLGLIHPTGCISIERCAYSSEKFFTCAVKAPVDDAASVTLHSPSDGEPFPFPIRDILAKFYEYGQYELHKVRMAIRFDNKTIKYVDVQAFPSELLPEARNKGQLKKVNIVDSVDDRHDAVTCGRGCPKLDIPTAFKEHLEVIENRMRDNGYNIKIHVPDDVIESEHKWFKAWNRGPNSNSNDRSFDLGGYMEGTYFLPLIKSAVLGTIKNGEFAIFEEDDFAGIVLRENHKIDNRFLPEPATKME